MHEKITISPRTKVGELLEAYPELEQVLMDMSPLFEKLKNPILRRTVARVATLQQVAAVGGLKVGDIVKRLRDKLGLTGEEVAADAQFFQEEAPQWFDREKIVSRFDAAPVIDSGGSPMAEIIRRTNGLKQGEIFELRTPFVPAPIIDMLKEKGFKVYSVRQEYFINSYFMR